MELVIFFIYINKLTNQNQDYNLQSFFANKNDYPENFVMLIFAVKPTLYFQKYKIVFHHILENSTNDKKETEYYEN